MKVWKYKIPCKAGTHRVLVQTTHKVLPSLHYSMDDDTLGLYIAVNPEDRTTTDRWALVAKTGEEIRDQGMTFLGSVRTCSGEWYHVFLLD